ncbi:hypothetical protein EV424DRAFT_1351270 [Suillus variegatus]|nr:hypothetical protein EV424DRAFT_1351270 [Suillus variegatus]
MANPRPGEKFAQEEWDIILPLLGSNTIKDPNDAKKILGVPDSLLELQVSQHLGDIMEKMERYMEKCKRPVMMIILIIHEVRSYRQPVIMSHARIWANTHTQLLTLEEWQHDNDRPVYEVIMSTVPHRWMDGLDIIIKTWLCHPDGHFHLSDTSGLYGNSTQIAPGPCTDITNLHAILEQGIVAIRNSIADYVEEECEHSQENLRALREWMPPTPIFDWDIIVDHVQKASLRDAHEWYKVWHTENVDVEDNEFHGDQRQPTSCRVVQMVQATGAKPSFPRGKVQPTPILVDDDYCMLNGKVGDDQDEILSDVGGDICMGLQDVGTQATGPVVDLECIASQERCQQGYDMGTIVKACPRCSSIAEEMEIDTSDDAVLKNLQAMSLEVNKDSVSLPMAKDVQDTINHLCNEVAELRTHNAAAVKLVNTMQVWLAAQDAKICTMETLCADIAILQEEVKTLHAESQRRDAQLRSAEAWVTSQGTSTTLLMDAYESLRKHIIPDLSGPSHFNHGMFFPPAGQVPSAGDIPPASLDMTVGQTRAMEHLYFNLTPVFECLESYMVANCQNATDPGSPWRF